MFGQPQTEVGDQGAGLFVADSEALVGGGASDLGLDLVDFRDATQTLGGDLGAVFLVDVVQFAPRVGPAIGQRQRFAADTPGFGQGVISSIPIDLQDAFKTVQDVHRMAAMAPGCIGEHDRGGTLAAPASIITVVSVKEV